jgi:hypothetical protein
METNNLLSCIITASSILVAVGFPFIIFIVSEHRNKKVQLLQEMKSYYPKLNLFRELIYYIFNTGVIKDYNRALLSSKNEEEKVNIENNAAYPFYKAFNYISKKYTDDVVNDYNIYRVFDFKEVNNYKYYSNQIWYFIDCRSDTEKELNIDRLENLSAYEYERLTKVINKFEPKYSSKKITIGLVASIAGEIEIDVANPLADLTKRYEAPLPTMLSYLFFVLSGSVIFGVVIPLLLLQFPRIQFSYLSKILVLIIILCFISVIVLTHRYLRGKN